MKWCNINWWMWHSGKYYAPKDGHGQFKEKIEYA